VAGGDGDCAGRRLVDDSIADNGRRRNPWGQKHSHAVAGEDFGGGGGEFLRGEAAVVADDEPPAGDSGLLGIVGDALGAEADVGKGEVLSDDGAPAVGTELDRVDYYSASFGITGLPLVESYHPETVSRGKEGPFSLVREKGPQLTDI